MLSISPCNSSSLLQARASTLMDAETHTLFQKWLMTKIIDGFHEMKKLTTLSPNSSLPITYDPRKRLCPVMDQGGCGSCVFFAITTLLSDMVSIQRKQPVIPLSVQYVMECMYYCFDQESTLPPQSISMDTICEGNSPFFVGTFLRRISSSSSVHGEGGCKKTGTVAETCKPYIVENIVMCQRKRSGVTWKLGTYILSCLLSIFLIVRILFLGKSTPAFHQKIDSLILISISLYFLVLMISCLFFVYRTKQRDRSTTPTLSKKEAKLSTLLILVTGAGFLLTFMALNRSLFHYNLSTGIYARNVILILIGACLVGSTIFMYYYEKHVVNLSNLPVLPTMNVSCDDKCADGSPIKTRYYVQDVYIFLFPSTTSLAEKIKTLKFILYSKGPIGVLIVPRYSFMILDNHGTIYDPEKKKNDPYAGGMHALCIIGWHKDAWILRNSWGSCWGDNGYCYWKMGSDQIENFCFFLTAEN